MNAPSDRHAFGYQVHGLRLSSNFPLDRIKPFSGQAQSETADIAVYRGDKLETSAAKTQTHIDSCDGFIRIRSQFGSVEIGQEEVELFPIQGVAYASLFSYYAVYILGFLLHLRDHLTLHASAVEVDGGVVAFIGPKGMGKSTTASVFYKQGHQILSDDLIACRPCSEDNFPQIDPGFPWMKLGENALSRILGREDGGLERSVPRSSKRIVPTHGRQPDQPLPLRRIYVLGYHGDNQSSRGVQVKPIGVKQACLFLLSNAFVQMFLDETASDSQHLDRCAILSRRVPMLALLRPQSLDALRSVYEVVRRDIETTTPAGDAPTSPQ